VSVAVRPNLVVVLLGLDGLCPASLKLSVKGSHWWLFGWVLFSLLFGCFCLVLLSSFLSAGSLPLPLPAFLLCLLFSSWGTVTYGCFSRICEILSCEIFRMFWGAVNFGSVFPSECLGRKKRPNPRITKNPLAPSHTAAVVWEGRTGACWIYINGLVFPGQRAS